jgi:hypothetical protein
MRTAIVMAAVACAAATASAQQPAAVTPAALQGMWKLTSFSRDGVSMPCSGYMVFTGNRYIFVTTRGVRPNLPEDSGRAPVEALSDSVKSLYVEAFRSMTAAAGTYSLVGPEIHYLREVVRSPQLTGKTEKRPSRFEGGRLIQDFIGGGERQVLVWERVTDLEK